MTMRASSRKPTMILKKENNKKLSVVIVNYKSSHYLARCLFSLQNATQQAMEIIIINNSPKEKLFEIEKDFPGVRIIVNSKNGGFGHGNNIGARAASGERLLFLNPDTEILAGEITEVISEFEKNNDIGVIGGCLLTEKNEVQAWSAGVSVNLWDLIKNNLGILSSRAIWKNTKKTEAGWVSGTSLFVPRKLFLEIGGFDENIFMYFEDVDLCTRIRAKGKRVVYFPSFKVLHKCGGSYEQESAKKQNKNYYDSLLYYFKKHRSGVEYMIVKVLRRLFFA